MCGLYLSGSPCLSCPTDYAIIILIYITPIVESNPLLCRPILWFLLLLWVMATTRVSRLQVRLKPKAPPAKSEEQLASEAAWREEERVWLVHRGGFAAGQLLAARNMSEPKVKVKLENVGQVVEVDQEDVEKANPPKFDRAENIASLLYLNESSVLHTIRQRYGSNLVHTYTGPSLLFVNPMHSVPLYTDKLIQMFKGCKQEDMPPHIYAVAQTAYRTMLSTRQDQSVIMLGHSGSGKSTNAQHVLNYLVTVAGSLGHNITGQKVAAMRVLMAAFGQCRTGRHALASRFVQLTSLDFDYAGNMAAASIQVLLLERGRVARRTPGERNFGIFYQLLYGCEQALRNELHLNSVRENNIFLKPLPKAEENKSFVQDWHQTYKAFSQLDFKAEEVKAILSVLAAIIHLGAAGATKGLGGKAQFADPTEADKAATLLGLTMEELAHSTFHPVTSRASSALSSPLSSSTSLNRTTSLRGGVDGLGGEGLSPGDALEGMATGLYQESFNAVVGLINRSLASNSRIVSSILVLDTPGFQNPFSPGAKHNTAASFQNLCDNYLQEKLHLLHYHTSFTAQQEKYDQENIDCSVSTANLPSPEPLVQLIERQPSHQAMMRPTHPDSKNMEQKGLLWLLDEEALFPGSNDESFIERLFIHFGSEMDKRDGLIRPLDKKPLCFVLNHLGGTSPVCYNTQGWLREARDNPTSKQAILTLQESNKSAMSTLFLGVRSSALPTTASVSTAESSASLRRVSSIRRAISSSSTASIKRKSAALQVKFQADSLVEVLRRTRVHFVHCFLPWTVDNKGVKSTKDIMDVPLVRLQLKGTRLLSTVRSHRQGYPESMMFGEFKRRFQIMAPPSFKTSDPPGLDDKKAAQDLIQHLDIDPTNFRLGLSQVFFRSGALAQLEDGRDDRMGDMIVKLQACCRGYLGRRKLQQRKVQEIAITCIQRNVRLFHRVRHWPWWRLVRQVLPLLDVHRTEEDLRQRELELDQLKIKYDKVEKERNELKINNDKLESKLVDVMSDLGEEHSTATHASEILESESAERMLLEKELKDLKFSHTGLQRKAERLEAEVMEARLLRASQMDDGDLSEDESDGSIYKERYERVRRENEFTQKKMKQEFEEEKEQRDSAKKAVERKLANALGDIEEQEHSISQLKKKNQKMAAEMQDLKLLLEIQQSRNSELEKKQRRFDGELARAHEEAFEERAEKERLQKERDHVQSQSYQLKTQLDDKSTDLEVAEKKVRHLQEELEDLSSSPASDRLDEAGLKQMKRSLHQTEAKVADQEEELDEMAGQVQILEQAKLRLEMQMERTRQEHSRQLEAQEEEMEELRGNLTKKVKSLEAQVEEEYGEKQVLVRQKNELEHKWAESQTASRGGAETEKKLQRQLLKTRALLADSQGMLDHVANTSATKINLKQLKNQLEDSQFQLAAATKAKQSLENELSDTQQQLEEITRSRGEAEDRYIQVTREKHELQSQLEENEEDLSEASKKHRNSVQQASHAEKQVIEHLTTIANLKEEKAALDEKLSEMANKLEYYTGNTVDKVHVARLEAKARNLESRLELEETTRKRQETLLKRHKEAAEKLLVERDQHKAGEQKAQEGVKRLQREIKEVKEDLMEVQKRETDASFKKGDLAREVEELQSNNEVLQSDLKLALKRVADLQAALEEEANSDLFDSEDSELDDEDDEDFETWMRKTRRSAGSSLHGRYGNSFDSTDKPSAARPRHHSGTSSISEDGIRQDKYVVNTTSSDEDESSDHKVEVAVNNVVTVTSDSPTQRTYTTDEYL